MQNKTAGNTLVKSAKEIIHEFKKYYVAFYNLKEQKTTPIQED